MSDSGRPVLGCRFRYSAVHGLRLAATQVASLCTYVRAWLIQVSGHVGLIHQHCHILSHCRAGWGYGPRSVLSRPASCAVPLCTYIRARLIRVSGHVELIHQHRYRVRIRPLVNRRRNILTSVPVTAGINTGTGRKSPTGTPLLRTSQNVDLTVYFSFC